MANTPEILMRAILLAATLALSPVPTLAQESVTGAAPGAGEQSAFNQRSVREAVATLAERLETDFVFPDKGRAYADMLRANLSAGRYDSFADPQAFAKTVTADLQAVHPDRHLRVHVVPSEARGGPQAENASGGGVDPSLNTITGSGWVTDDVAYISFDAFFGTPATMSALENFIAEHAGARALIIDIRGHRGGDLAEMDLLLPHVFSEATTLVAMDTRASVVERGSDGPTAGRLRRVAAPEGVVREEHYVDPRPSGAFHQAKVFLLTSKRSASAAEHLALAFKRTGRALLIGETTYGAGNFGEMVPLDEGYTYAAFVPNGRTFDPDTGIGWEGTGITPDVPVSAEDALEEALRLASEKSSPASAVRADS